MDRRTFLRYSALAPFAPAALLAAPKHLLQMNGYAQNAETPLELLTDYITPVELFFVRSHWIPRMRDLKTWRLTIDGDTKRPLKLTLTELKKMPRAEATCVLQCAGNGRGLQEPTVPGVQWRYGAVGNARWRGVRVKDVLERAGIRDSAKHLHLFGSDDPPGKVPPFHRSIEIGKALDDCILAWEMNGVPLPPQHGAPLRFIVPGWAGDHWMKWIVRISASAEEQKGFYMDTAYRWPLTPGAPGVAFKPEEMKPLTEMSVKSNITTAPKRAKVGVAQTIRGFAFSGAPDIAKVEISQDNGDTWSEATLDPRHDSACMAIVVIRVDTSRRRHHASLRARHRQYRRGAATRRRVESERLSLQRVAFRRRGGHGMIAKLRVLLACLALSATTASADLPSLGTEFKPLPPSKGKAQTEAACLACHSTDILVQQRLTPKQWTASVEKMMRWGAAVEEKDKQVVIDYLARHFGPSNKFTPTKVRTIQR